MLQLPVTVRLRYNTTTREQSAENFFATEELTEPVVMKLSGISVYTHRYTQAHHCEAGVNKSGSTSVKGKVHHMNKLPLLEIV